MRNGRRVTLVVVWFDLDTATGYKTVRDIEMTVSTNITPPVTIHNGDKRVPLANAEVGQVVEG